MQGTNTNVYGLLGSHCGVESIRVSSGKTLCPNIFVRETDSFVAGRCFDHLEDQLGSLVVPSIGPLCYLGFVGSAACALSKVVLVERNGAHGFDWTVEEEMDKSCRLKVCFV